MIAYKIKTATNIPEEYYSQFNNVKRIGYKRMQEGMSAPQAIAYVKSKMKHIELMDASLIEYAVKKASFNETACAIFGSKSQFNRLKFKKGVAEVEQKLWQEKRNSSIYLVGRKMDTGGNRKAQIDVENNRILLKWNKTTHFSIPLPQLSKKWHRELTKLQELCARHEACFTLEIKRDSVSILVDEVVLADTKAYVAIPNRILSMDLNPNYIGVVVQDYNTGQVITKHIYDTADLNAKDASDDKRLHEMYHITQQIVTMAKHYRCERVAFELLNMKTKNHKKGRNLNRLINNQWPRSKFIASLKKNCNIAGIQYSEIYAAYSSTMGQVMNPKEFDSIAAAMEINRRCQETLTTGNSHVKLPSLVISELPTRWKEMAETSTGIESWVDLHNCIKKSALSYRVLFNRDKFSGVSFRSFSRKSGVLRHQIE